MKLPYLLDIIAIGVFAISGCLTAGRQKLDLIGVIVISVVTAVGGGTLRDLLLDRHPIFWIRDPNFLYAILGAIVITIGYVRFRPPPNQVLLIVDGLGLSVYTIVGAQFAEEAGRGGIVAVVMGTMTGTAGGVIRDILCNEVPFIIRGQYFYATAAVAGATCYVVLQDFIGREMAAYLGMFTVGFLRLGSIIYEWNLPEFKLDDWVSP